jgi:hypothetical protein
MDMKRNQMGRKKNNCWKWTERLKTQTICNILDNFTQKNVYQNAITE